MVLQRRTLERYIPKSSELAKKAGIPANQMRKALKALETDLDSNRRQPAPPCPEGGISQSAAARKYKVGQSSISRWVSKGYIPVVLRTNRQVYVEEATLAKIVMIYKEKPGQGCRILEKKIKAA